MSKIYSSELIRLLTDSGIGVDREQIESTPVLYVYHKHGWHCGYDGFYGVMVRPDGSYDYNATYSGTRRQFYKDLREITEFIYEYFICNGITNAIAAPFYRYNQFSTSAEHNDINNEIYDFLRKNKVRRGERSGIEISVTESFDTIEMLIEGGFRGISELCLFIPDRRLLIVPGHHFELAFFMQGKEREKAVISSIIKKHENLSCS